MNIAIDLRSLQTKYYLSKQRFVFGLVSTMLEIDMVNRYKFIYDASRKDLPSALSFVNSEEVFVTGGKLFGLGKKDVIPELLGMNHVILVDRVDRSIVQGAKVVMLFTGKVEYERAAGRDLEFLKSVDLIAVSTKVLQKQVMEELELEEKRVIHIKPALLDQAHLKRPELEVNRSVRSRLGMPADYLLYLGTVEKGRNLDFLIRVFEKLPKAIDLVIAGPVVRGGESYFRMMDDSTKRNHIHYAGILDDKVKLSVLSLAKIVCLPQYEQDFSLTMLEAFSLGVPVIASNTSATAAFAAGGCLLASPFQEDEWLTGINLLMEDEQARSAQIHWQNEVVRQYNIKDSAKDLLLALSVN